MTTETATAEINTQAFDGADYWHALIDERPAAEFIGVTPRTIQSYRQKGDGPKFIRISSRCIRYRRCDLRNWVETRLRNSTADTGKAA